MKATPRKYDSTVARMAGNIVSGIASHYNLRHYNLRDEEIARQIATAAVLMARFIVEETKRTEPVEQDTP